MPQWALRAPFEVQHPQSFSQKRGNAFGKGAGWALASFLKNSFCSIAPTHSPTHPLTSDGSSGYFNTVETALAALIYRPDAPSWAHVSPRVQSQLSPVPTTLQQPSPQMALSSSQDLTSGEIEQCPIMTACLLHTASG